MAGRVLSTPAASAAAFRASARIVFGTSSDANRVIGQP